MHVSAHLDTESKLLHCDHVDIWFLWFQRNNRLLLQCAHFRTADTRLYIYMLLCLYVFFVLCLYSLRIICGTGVCVLFHL